MVDARVVRNFYVLCCVTLLAACSNGRGSLDAEEQPPPPSGGAEEGFTVSGTITGLDGDGLVLQLNGGSDLALSNDGAFTFTPELATSAAYSVTVLTQPSGPSQTCTVGSGTGTIASADVTNVSITCATGAFALTGTVSGLAGTGLVLQNNGGADLPITANGPFSFPAPIASGAPYSITVRTQPTGPSQSCSVSNGTGTVGSADVTNVTVACTTGTFSIGGTVSGLTGSGLELRNNGGSPLAINGNGPFQFPGLASGATYNVTVSRNPSGPAQNCTVSNASGTVASASVTNIAVVCMTDRFTIGGSISGLAAGSSGVVLQLNAGNDITIRTNGSFAFSNALASGTPYQVTVRTQPANPAQECAVTRGVGVVASANVSNVAITCTTRKFSVGGDVSGLQGDGLVLQKNGADDLAIASNGRYTFQTEQDSGTPYQVTVRTPPTGPSQNCTIANASGTIGSGDVRNANVTCSVSSFKIGGTVSGLLGQGLVLRNNGGNNLNVGANGAFQFTQAVASGSNYNVEVVTQPSNPTQTCSVVSGTGTVGASDVTSVVVNCSTSDFTVGGTIENLAGTGLVLQNNNGDDLRVDAGNTFTFPTPVPSGAPFSVTVLTQPTGPAQQCDVVANPTGTVGGANVTNVQITCVTTEFTVGGTVSGLNGTGFVLQNNGADSLAIAANGPFEFPTSVPNGAPYSVTVGTAPTGPNQSCLITNGDGTVNGADVTNVEVVCTDLPPPI